MFFLRGLFGHPVATLRDSVRPRARHLVDAVANTMWQAFVKPSVTSMVSTPSPEEALFLSRLRGRASSSLWSTIVEHANDQKRKQRERNDLRATFKDTSAQIFTARSEELIWRHLAVRAGLLPDIENDYVGLSCAQLAYLSSKTGWGGRCR